MTLVDWHIQQSHVSCSSVPVMKGRTLTPICTDGVGWVARCAKISSYILASRLPPAVAMFPRLVSQQMFVVWLTTHDSRLGHTALLLSTRMHYSSPLGSRCIGYESTYWEALRVWVLCHSRVGVVLVIFWESLYPIYVLFYEKILHKSELSWICDAS